METRKLKRDGLYVGNAGYLYDFAVTRNLASLLPPAKKVMRKFAAWAIDNPLYYLPVDDLLLDPELSTADRAHLAAMKNANNYPVRWLVLGEGCPFARDAAPTVSADVGTRPSSRRSDR